jgi:hypothetical protein
MLPCGSKGIVIGGAGHQNPSAGRTSRCKLDVQFDAASVLKILVAQDNIDGVVGGWGAGEKRTRFHDRSHRRDRERAAAQILAYLTPQLGVVFDEENPKRHCPACGNEVPSSQALLQGQFALPSME